ncbi:MAG: pyridoxine 5'-phosphate synthase [Polyangiales bacterium]
MIRLSVNVNKVATLRNSRGGAMPSVVEAAEVCLAAGAGGITVHPRLDQRHIRPDDVRELAVLLHEPRTRGIEYNIEGDPRPEWLALVHEVRPDQATLVPVRPGEVTSEAGWSEQASDELQGVIGELHRAGIRVSVFVDAKPSSVEWAQRVGAERVELYTGPFAAAHARGASEGRAVFAEHVLAAKRAHALGLGINAGHDLDLDNLPLYRTLPHLAEVSIGHALMSRALFVGLERTVREYLTVLAG